MRMSQMPQSDLEYINLLRSYIEPGSTVNWPDHHIQYKIFPTSKGWSFEWEKDGQSYALPEENQYLLYHFKYRGITINDMLWDDWLSSLNKTMCEQLNIESLI